MASTDRRRTNGGNRELRGKRGVRPMPRGAAQRITQLWVELCDSALSSFQVLGLFAPVLTPASRNRNGISAGKPQFDRLMTKIMERSNSSPAKPQRKFSPNHSNRSHSGSRQVTTIGNADCLPVLALWSRNTRNGVERKVQGSEKFVCHRLAFSDPPSSSTDLILRT